MKISQLAYELYKIDWMARIPSETQIDTVKQWYQEQECSLEEYLFEHGYNGEIYVSYEEFLNSEYQEDAYMEDLFRDEKLFAEYKRDFSDAEVHSNMQFWKIRGYDKDNDVYQTLEVSGDLEYLKMRVKDIAEIQKDTDEFRDEFSGEPFDWFEVQDEAGNCVLCIFPSK